MVKKRKIIKRIISYILVFALCLPFPGFVISQETVKAKAKDMALYLTWHDGILWGYTNNDDGTVTLGANVLDGFTDAAGLADLVKYSQKYPKPAYVEVPKYLDGKLVTGISMLLDKYVEELVLPDSIINIYSGAFKSFENLKSLTIPGSVKYIQGLCVRKDYDGVIYTTSGSYVEQYAKEKGIRYFIIEEPEIEEIATPVPTARPTERPVQIVTKRPIITSEEPASTPKVTPTARPVPTVEPVPTPTLRPATSPVSTVKPAPEVTNTPKVTFTPKPEYTAEPGFSERETPSPEPEYTPEPSKTPDIEIQINVNPSELRSDAQGNFYDNEINISVTGVDNYSIETGKYSWLKVSKENLLAKAMEKIVFTEKSYNSFYVFADKNTTTSARTGNITITANNGEKKETRTIKVMQEAEDTKLSISVSKITANSKGDTSVSSVNVKTYSSGGFSVDNCGYSWIKAGNSNSDRGASSNISFESDGTFYVFISENTSNKARSGKIKVTHENGGIEEIINVSQEGKKTVLNADTERKTADNKGIFYNNSILVETSGTGYFTATVEDADWLKLSSKNTSSFLDGMTTITLDKDSYIYLLADKNTGGERTATISITHESGNITKEIEVYQMGKDSAYLYIDRESAYFDEPVQSISRVVTVSADEETDWTVTSSNDWIKIIKSDITQNEQYSSIEGTGKGSFYILVKENNTYEERNGYVTVSAPGIEDYKIYVYQTENEISIDSLLAELSISVSKKTFKKGKTSKIKLNYPEGLYASDIKSVKFSSNKKKVATVNSKGIIKGIKKGKAVITIKVTLENGNSKTFKAKITVDKRKVKLSKFE